MPSFNRIFYTLLASTLVISPHVSAEPLPSQENAKIKALTKDGVRIDPPIPTDDWLITLKPGQQMNDIAAQMGIGKYKGVGALKDTFVITMPSSAKNSASTKSALKSMQGIKTAEQQIARKVYPRVAISDGLFPSQWHLDKANGTNFNGTPGIDANVVNAWNNHDVDGSGVTIGIVDDGFQHTHPDFVSKYNANASYDYNGNDSDPSPNTASDFHGAAVGGVAGADNDGSKCGVGAAYNATMAGLRLIAAPITSAQIADALSYTETNVSQKNTIDIFNNSWGPGDFGEYADGAFDSESFYLNEFSANFPFAVNGASTLALSAIEDGITNGRSGKGVIYVWAAGNGRTASDNSNYEGYSNSRHTIAVGAVRGAGDGSSVAGQYSFYSEPGANIFVTAPSNNFSGQGIRTTDLTGVNGYNAGAESTGDVDCTDSFGGTSSAAPLVAGIVGLMLDANPALTWRDVQHILAETASKNHALNFNGSTNTDWSTNGAGFDINHNYGFGLIDADAAVAAAKTWTNVAAATSVTSPVKTVNTAIPNNNSTGITSTINITNDIKLEHVEVVFNATHPFRGDLKVELTNLATGTTSVLSEVSLDPYDNLTNWKFMTVRNWGESSVGTWQLKVTDTRDRTTPEYSRNYSNTGTFGDWQLILHGTQSAPSPPDDVDDILLRHNNGSVIAWLMNDGQINASPTIGTAPNDWTIKGVADFNNDGTDDILWRNNDGRVQTWLINNAQLNTSNDVSTLPADWVIKETGDFNNDGTDDILLRNNDGRTSIWFMSNGQLSSEIALTTVSTDWTIKGTGDFNNDGTDDILWRHSNGLLFVWLINNGQIGSALPLVTVSTDWAIKGTGDFNNDGTDDILWRHSSGLVFVWLMNNGQISSALAVTIVSNDWTISGTGDFNNDGTDDIIWQHTSNLIYVWLLNNGKISTALAVGNLSNDLAIKGAGDFNK